MTIKRSKWLGAVACAVTLTAASSPASAQQQQKPNILFIMGDDIGWMQPHIYHRGLMVGELCMCFELLMTAVDGIGFEFRSRLVRLWKGMGRAAG